MILPRTEENAGILPITLAVVAAGFVLFHGWRVVAGQELFFTHDLSGSDLWHLHYPLKHVYSQSLASGKLPLWSHGLGTGMPVLAEGQVGALYPPNLVLYRLLPLPIAFNAAILLHVLLSGAFAAMLASAWGAGRAGSVLAGTVFAFCGFNVAHLKHINMTAAAAWAPLLFLLLHRYARGRQTGTAAALALVVALILLAGHPQIAYYTLLIGGVNALAEARSLGGWKESFRYLLGCASGVVLGAMLAAPQILPTLELTQLGSRQAGLSLREAQEFEYHPAYLLTFLAPKAFGDPGELRDSPGGKLRGFVPPRGNRNLFWEVTGYVGLLPLLLAVLALARAVRDREALPLLAMLVISLLLTIDWHGGLAALLHFVLPGFSYFRFHDRFLLFVDLNLALFAGLGLRRVLDRLERWPRRYLAAVSVIALVFSFADLQHALGDQNPTIETSRWTSEPATARAIRARQSGRAEPFRMADVDPARTVFLDAYRGAGGWKGDLAPYDAAKEIVNSNLNLLYDLDGVNFYQQLFPERARLASLLIYAKNPKAGPPFAIDAKLASLFGVGYFLSTSDLGGLPAPFFRRTTTLLSSERPPRSYVFQVRENPGAMPRAFLVPSARFFPARTPAPPGATSSAQAEIIRVMRSERFDPALEVLIEGEPPASERREASSRAPIEAPVRFVAYESDRVHLRADAPAPCWLFLSDTYFPGWRAEVDGAAVKIHPANLAGRAVQVPSGSHDIVFRYQPRAFHAGFSVSILGGVLLATWAGWRRIGEWGRSLHLV